jgi:hypothetical protein
LVFLAVVSFVLSAVDSDDEHEIAKEAEKSKRDTRRPDAGYGGDILVQRNGKIECRRWQGPAC